MKSSDKSSPSPTPLIEPQWVDIIVRSFVKDMDINPCVFQIPRSLRDSKPEAYTPRQLWLGPYRSRTFGPEFIEMETQKCTAVRKFLSKDHNLGFKDLVVDRMTVLEPTIRACYNKYLDFSGNTLAWIMAIDGLYLLQFLSTNYLGKHGAVADVHHVQSLAMDIMMLENQIPTVLLKEIRKALKLQPSNQWWLLEALYHFCEQQSPLKLSEFQSDFGHQVHLLDYMYQLIVNHQIKEESTSPITNTDHKRRASNLIRSGISRLIGKTRGAVSTTTTGITKIAANSAVVAQTALDTAVAFGFKGAIMVQTNLKLMQKMHQLLPASMRKSHKSALETADQAMPSLDHEIDIPTVSELCEASKIQFKFTTGGIRDVEFNMDDVMTDVRKITNTVKNQHTELRGSLSMR